MEYKGKKIGFKRTTGAMRDLTKLAPDGDINRFTEIFNEKNLGASIEASAQFLSILNKWYEKALAFEDPGYTPDPVPEDYFLMLDMDSFTEVFNEAMAQFTEDDKPTVQAEAIKDKKND